MSELDVRCYIVGNGPALSPDGRLLYTVESSGHPCRPKGVHVSRVAPSGELKGQRLLIGWDPDTGGVLETAGIGSAG
jgi:sugar lactone lactonase YvrE